MIRCRGAISGAPLAPSCAGVLTQDDSLPSINIVGGQRPGASGAIEFRGHPGAFARVHQGRFFARAPQPMGFVPRLVSLDRTSAVGPFMASGPVTWNFVTLPFPRGARFHFQTAQPSAASGLTWSNAMSLIVD